MSVTLVNGIYAEHGRYTTYGNKGCRCAACTRAWADWHREHDHAVGRHVPLFVHHALVYAQAELRDNHGTETRYTRGCRCDDCRRAGNAARNARRKANREHIRAYDRERKRRERQAVA